MIVNGPAYGDERSYNALRLAGSMAQQDGVAVRVFLMGDGVTCAVSGQSVPEGYYHLDRMLATVLRYGGHVGCCGTCLDARGLAEVKLVDGARRSTLKELTDWTIEADKTLVF